MKKYFLATALVASALIIAGAGCSFTESNKPEVKTQEKTVSQEMMKDENTMMKDAQEIETGEMMEQKKSDDMMKEDTTKKDGSMMKEEAMMKTSGQYVAYDASKLALAAQGPVVLFFHAPWCPTCKAANTDINANLAAIPAGTTILKVDYDTNPELKKKYGVTYQHTFVQVNADGSMIKKWSGGNTLSSITAQIK